MTRPSSKPAAGPVVARRFASLAFKLDFSSGDFDLIPNYTTASLHLHSKNLAKPGSFLETIF